MPGSLFVVTDTVIILTIQIWRGNYWNKGSMLVTIWLGLRLWVGEDDVL